MGPEEITPNLLATCAPPPVAEDSDKEDRGRLLVLAGGAQVAGAAILVGLAGLRVGAGKLQMAAIPPLAAPLALAMPEARVLEVPATRGELSEAAAQALAEAIARSDAVVVGPGMIDEAVAGELTRRLLARAEHAAFVVDAAALTGLAGRAEAARGAGGRLVVTPHAGEMATLLGQPKAAILEDPLGAARALAADFQAVVVMKGAQTFVVSPDGRAWTHRFGLPGLATSGSGDVLAGIIGGLLARGAAPMGAAAWGVWLHRRAGARLAERLGPLGFLARELLDELPAALGDALGEAVRP